MADKVRKNDRVTICTVSDGASMEGEAKEAFAAIPGLAAKDRLNPFVLVVSDNDTKLSGRISKDAFSMEPTFAAMSALGWNVIKVANGNDLQAVYLAVEKGLATGAGQSATRRSASGPKQSRATACARRWKAPRAGTVSRWPTRKKSSILSTRFILARRKCPPNWRIGRKALRADWEQKEAAKKAKAAPRRPAAAAVKKEKIQAGLAKGAVRAAQEGLPVYSISADVEGSTGISFFQKSFPDRFIEVGMAEANMISTGAGFSKAGFIPIVDTFGQFGVTKGNLPLTMAALSQAPVIAIFSHVGFQDAADGASHEATTYFAAVSAIPHTVVIACSCADEAEALMYEAIKRTAREREQGHNGESVIFFVGRENYPLHWLENAKYEWGKAEVLAEGKRRGHSRLRPAGGPGDRRRAQAQGAKHFRHRHRQSVHQPGGFGDHRARRCKSARAASSPSRIIK